MTNIPAPGADLATDELPNLPAPFGCIDIYDGSGCVRSVDGFTADQMRGYALDTLIAALKPRAATLAAVPAREPRYTSRKHVDQLRLRITELEDELKVTDDHNEKLRAEAKANRAAAPAPVSGMPDLASLQRYDLAEHQHGSGHMVYWDKSMDEESGGEWVKFTDVERLLNPTKEPK